MCTKNCCTDKIVCEDARIGVAVQWTSSDSKQRGVVKVADFGLNNQIVEMCAEKDFGKAQLRGEVTLKTILYVATAGIPKDNESHLANTEGYEHLEEQVFLSSFAKYQRNNPFVRISNSNKRI